MTSSAAHATPGPALDLAREYLARGWQPVPVPLRAKGPTVPGWQKLCLTLEQLPRFFGGSCNIGILLGTPSGGLVDVDLDSPAARVVGAHLLPPTEAIFGRASSPRSHYLYQVSGTGVARTRQLRHPGVPQESDDAMLVELRANGAQTVFPGSIHPSGEPIRWDRAGAPAQVAAPHMERVTDMVAAGALLVRFWRKGQRNHLQLALAGALLRARWTPEEATRFICAVGAGGGDDDAATRAKVAHIVRLTAAKVAQGEPVVGLPTLAEVIGDEPTTRRLVAWLRLPLMVVDGDTVAAGARHANGRQALDDAPSISGSQASRGVWVRLSQVAPEQVEWVWDMRIPRGKLTLIGGDPGVGKSFLLLALLTHVTRGYPWPDGARCPGPADCILLCGEDGLADTIRPRVDALGGDPERVWPFKGMLADDGSVRGPSLASALDVAEIERKVVEVGAQLVLVDPINTYLDAKLDTFKGPPVRSITTPLAGLAERTGVAVVLVCHLTKATLQQALYRMPGSVDFVAAARSVLAVGYDPDPERSDGRRLLLPVKNNLSAHAPGLGFNIVGGALQWDRDDVSANAAAMLAGAAPAVTEEHRQGGRPPKVGSAAQLLRLLLARGPLRATEIFAALGESGFSEKTVKRAKDEAQVESIKLGKGAAQAWYWRLRADAPHAAARDDSAPGPGATRIGPLGCDPLENSPPLMADLHGHERNSADGPLTFVESEGFGKGFQAGQNVEGQNRGGQCSDCGAPIAGPYGRCADCRQQAYRASGLDDPDLDLDLDLDTMPF